MLSTINYIINKTGLVRKVAKLEFKSAGTDTEEMPYVEMKSGLKIFGMKSSEKDKKYYKLLPSKVKYKLPFPCFAVATDVVIRYIEGGLKYKGPRKEMFYTVKDGDYIAEMGAYMGHYTLYLSKKVGDKGKVIAIEPLPDNLKVLQKNIKSNNINNVIIVPKGVWKEKGEMVFNRKKGDTQSGSVELSYKSEDQFSIPVDSLDNILEENKIEHLDLMLIQLNGLEPHALEGLNKIKPGHFSIAARYDKDNENSAELIKMKLEKRNYNVNIIEKDYVFAKLKKE